MNQEQSNKSSKELIVALGSADGMIRHESRQALVHKGEKAVDDLIRVFKENVGPLHFEAAKALSQIGSPKAVQTFIEALEDEEFIVRWVAAEGLCAIGVEVINPLLNILKHHSDTILLREGIHHVFYDFVSRKLVNEKTSEILKAVLASYSHLEVEISISVAAKKALDSL